MVIAAAAFWFFAGTALAAPFQDMVCKGKSSRMAAICRAKPLGEAKDEIICLSAGQDDSPRIYRCAYQIRDWGATSSPYAHTSRVWTCRGGEDSVYLFEQDYHIDANRCDILCGRCNSGWRPAGEKTGP